MFNKILEMIGAVLFAALVILFFVLFLFATPDQKSGECEILTHEMGS